MRILVLTHTFPPSRHSNAKRPYYLVKGLLEAGWDVEVWTSQLGMEHGDVESAHHPGLKVLRIDDPIFRWRPSLTHRGRLARWYSLITAALLWPDSCGLWSRKIARNCRSRSNCFDRVLAFVFPSSLLLCGAVRGLVDGRWVFDYQESVSPQLRLVPRRSPVQKWGTPRLERLERATLHQAGRVVFTTESNRDAYLAAGLVPEEVTRHVPYFYDDAVFKGKGGTTGVDSGFEIRYFGGFDLRGDRNPATFLSALAAFLERNPEARAQTKFVFHGAWLTEHDQLVLDLELTDVVAIRAAVGYEEYLALLKSSPVLLLVVSAAHNLFMPSKIVDYFGAGRPILAFLPAESEMHRVLDAVGMAEFACGERNAEAGVKALERLWSAYVKGRLGVTAGNSRFWSSEVQIPRYLDILNQMT